MPHQDPPPRTDTGALLRLLPRPPRVGGEALVYAALTEDGEQVALRVARHPNPFGAWLHAEHALLRTLAARPELASVVIAPRDTGTWAQRPFFVLPWHEDTLASWCLREPRPSRRLPLLEDTCRAVAALHRAQPAVVHGDLKPTNILVDPHPDATSRVRLCDFGAARAVRSGHTRTWHLACTLGFAPPEARLDGPRPIDPRWDVWSLAATVHFSILGEPPSPRTDGLPARSAARLRAALGPTVDTTPLIAALHAALRLAPARRRTTAVELAEALRHAQAPQTAPARWRVPRRVAAGAWPMGALLLGAPAHPDLPVYPTQRVSIPGEAPLLAGAVEVDQALWARVTGEDPNLSRRIWDGDTVGAACDTYRGVTLAGARLPATCVDWLDAVQFANALSRAHGLQPAYTVRVADPSAPAVTWDEGASGWRLPTASEWRAYAGSAPAIDATLCAQENFADRTALRVFTTGRGESPCEDGFVGSAPVDALRANAAGVHHAHGNVAEWLWDPAGDGRRAAAGASWAAWPKTDGIGAIGPYATDWRGITVGVRLVRRAR